MSPSSRITAKQYGLKDTRPRRLVLKALEHMKKAGSPYDIQKWIRAKGDTINVVTVYRIMGVFERMRIVHRHPCDGHFFLCSHPRQEGHHGFLRCTSCGKTEEFCDETLRRAGDHAARASGFQPSAYISDILGICKKCSH